MNDTTLGGIMSRRVYTPRQDRTYHNGIFKDAKESNSIDDTEFCKICDALTLHTDNVCVRCYPHKLKAFKSQTTNKKNNKGRAANGK